VEKSTWRNQIFLNKAEEKKGGQEIERVNTKGSFTLPGMRFEGIQEE